MIPPTSTYAYFQLPGDPNKPKEIADYLKAKGVTYGLGSKDPDLANLDDFTQIDCSGERDVTLYHMTNGEVNLGVGQYNSQYTAPWCQQQGFKESTPEDARDDRTGNLYIFMLPAEVEPSHIGHTGFTRNGVTAESHGGPAGSNGPGSRNVSDCWGWFSKCRVWVLQLGTV